MYLIIQELRAMEAQQLQDKDTAILRLEEEVDEYREKMANLETSLEMAEMTVQE